MAGSDSSVRGGNHGDEEPPVAQVELRQMANSLLEAMERMFNERLPAAGGRGPHHQHEDNHHEEFGDENSGFGNGFHDYFRGYACMLTLPSAPFALTRLSFLALLFQLMVWRWMRKRSSYSRMAVPTKCEPNTKLP